MNNYIPMRRISRIYDRIYELVHKGFSAEAIAESLGGSVVKSYMGKKIQVGNTTYDLPLPQMGLSEAMKVAAE